MSVISPNVNQLEVCSGIAAENEKNAIYSSIKSIESLSEEIFDSSSSNVKDLVLKVFAHQAVSDFLIYTSRLDVFAKDFSLSFDDDIDFLLIIRKLKYFYNQPTGAVLEQLATLVQRNSCDAAKVSRWNEVVKMLTADKTLSTMAVRRFLQETGCPKCYIENAEYLEKFDPHGIYPTTIYGRCSGEVLAKPDASVVAITSRYTLTTTAKIVYDVLNPTNPELRAVYQPIGRCVTIIDKNVENIYGTAIQAYFDEHSIELIKLVTSAEEIDKDITNLQDVLVQLKTLGVRRNEPLLVVGNGVLHDVIACAASLYHRNTPYVMLSTSVVAAIDAGLSPRTGCDGFGFKNLFGSYHPPVLALTDRSFFRTLKLGCMRHGIAEIVKMAVVKDEELFCLLEQNAAVILSTKLGTVMEDFEGNHAAFQDICDLIIGKALEDYMRSEYGNMFETHQCRPHAYGHTWSPGYELPAGMLHGHAVATGMGFGAYLSFCNGWITQHEFHRILKLLSDLELSLWHPVMEDTQLVYKGQNTMIQKRAGNLAAPVPKGLGKCGYINDMPYDLLGKRLGEYRKITLEYPRQGMGIEVHCMDIGIACPKVGNLSSKNNNNGEAHNGVVMSSNLHCNGEIKEHRKSSKLTKPAPLEQRG